MDQRDIRGPVQPDSLAPVEGHRLSVEAEASLMNRGRGRQLAAIAGIALLLVAGGIVLLQRINRGQQYADAATAASRIEREDFNAYFACVLPGVRPAQLSTAARVHTAFERLGDRLGRAYAQTLQSCAPRLQELQSDVAALAVPEKAKPEHAALVAASAALAQANTSYMNYLSRGNGEYDYVRATPLLEKYGLAWEAYTGAHAALLAVLEDGM